MALVEPTYEESARNKKHVREVQRKNDWFIAGALLVFFNPKTTEWQAFKGALIALAAYHLLQRPDVDLKEDTSSPSTEKLISKDEQ